MLHMRRARVRQGQTEKRPGLFLILRPTILLSWKRGSHREITSRSLPRHQALKTYWFPDPPLGGTANPVLPCAGEPNLHSRCLLGTQILGAVCTGLATESISNFRTDEMITKEMGVMYWDFGPLRPCFGWVTCAVICGDMSAVFWCYRRMHDKQH